MENSRTIQKMQIKNISSKETEIFVCARNLARKKRKKFFGSFVLLKKTKSSKSSFFCWWWADKCHSIHPTCLNMYPLLFAFPPTHLSNVFEHPTRSWREVHV
jgi:hypothetical protein